VLAEIPLRREKDGMLELSEHWLLKISNLNSTIFLLIVVTAFGSALQMPLSGGISANEPS